MPHPNPQTFPTPHPQPHPQRPTRPRTQQQQQQHHHHHHQYLVQLKIARNAPRLAPSNVARWEVVVSSAPDDAVRSYSGHTCHLLDRPSIFMAASLDSAESLRIRSERHVTSCRGGQVELVVWLAQMVPAMPSILGDHSRIRTGRIWRWCRMAPPPRRVRANQSALRLCRSRLFALTFGG